MQSTSRHQASTRLTSLGTSNNKRWPALLGALLLVTSFASSAAPFSETLKDESAGPNTSFEMGRDGRPFNWSLYTPATTGSQNFVIALDTSKAVGGKQSLRIASSAPHPGGGRLSPGFFRELPARPGDVWELRFQAWSDGADFVMEAGGVSALHAGTKTQLRWKEKDAGWKSHVLKVSIPDGMDHLRIQFNVLGVGSVNVDDVVLTRLSQRSTVAPTSERPHAEKRTKLE